MSTSGITLTGPIGHRARFAAFCAIGAFLFWFGIGLQMLLTGGWHLSAVVSFAIQGVLSVELSFLLNRYWTWRSEPVSFWRAWRRFNGQKALVSLLNLLVYAGLLRLGVNYLVANLATTALFTAVNYAGAHVWVFRADSSGLGPRRLSRAVVSSGGQAVSRSGTGLNAAPVVSVVVPCRGSERTIRATVDSLLGQDYPGVAEVILVGSAGDTTWQALDDVDDPRLVTMEVPDTPGLRDPNVKRNVGMRRARGDIIALADSDIVMSADWIRRGISLLAASGVNCVAGGMASIHDSFWGRFVDGTKMAAKTPRIPESYLVTRQNFGRYGRKPPVTANVIITRQLYENCLPDARWAYGYEDYEWFWRVTSAGNAVLLSKELCGRHHHRRGLWLLCREYLRSADGCARFICRHPVSPLARKRLLQALLLPVAALLLVGAEATAAVLISPLMPLLGTGLIAAVTAAWEYAQQRNREALLYPLINLILGSVFLFGLVRSLLRIAVGGPADHAVMPVAMKAAYQAPAGGQLVGASR